MDIIGSQNNSRLYNDKLSCFSIILPSLFSRIVPSNSLRLKTKKYINRICTTTLNNEIHK